MSLMKRCFAEVIGTFGLVWGGVGSAVLAANFPSHEPGNPLGSRRLLFGIFFNRRSLSAEFLDIVTSGAGFIYTGKSGSVVAP